jgi:AcrR family transcriptional regulator
MANWDVHGIWMFIVCCCHDGGEERSVVRLTRVQQQARTRAAVLEAATAEFAEHGYADARVDRIAERAELTRGAVYSNFPGKRALYLAVLLDSERLTDAVLPAPVGVADAAEAFARVWLERLPLAGDTAAGGKLRARSLIGVFDDQPGRAVMAELARLEALLLALALESSEPRQASRRLRLAELILTLLNGAGHLAQSAPGFGDPFDVARACRHLTGIDLPDVWNPAYLPYVGPPQVCRDSWRPPPELTDEITARPVAFDGDGIVVVLGSGRLGAAEEAVRAARPGDLVTVAAVTSDPAEIGALMRLRITEVTTCLRRAFPPAAAAPVRLVIDERAAIAAAVGVDATDDIEAAVRVRSGEVIARATGRGAGYAVAGRNNP